MRGRASTTIPAEPAAAFTDPRPGCVCSACVRWPGAAFTCAYGPSTREVRSDTKACKAGRRAS